MNYVENALNDLHRAIAHAQYEGFSDINYQKRDYKSLSKAKTTEERTEAMSKTVSAVRRPNEHDFYVYAMFPQVWGSTALGHGGIGGSAITTAYTIILFCKKTQEYLVYFGGTFCYKVLSSSLNFDNFIDDCKNHCLASKNQKSRYD